MTLTLDIPPGEWLTANDRRHWADRQKRTKALRMRGKIAGVNFIRELRREYGHRVRLPLCKARVRVVATLHTRTNTRLDPANSYPTIKALVDGLTDAGLWADDDSEHLIGPDMRRGEPDPTMRKGWRRIVITIEAAEEEK